MRDSGEIREVVRRRYGEIALRVHALGGCCSGESSAHCCNPVAAHAYDRAVLGEMSPQARRACLCCGNPRLAAETRAGDTVLDLGCGAGIDVMLAARCAGPTGKAYGLDMTAEMLVLAEANKRRSGLSNVEFLQGEIEAIPLPPASVDLVISNGAISLSADKERAFAEAFRVLRPGGRLAVADVVAQGELPEAIRDDLELWCRCLAGALSAEDYASKLRGAGFAMPELDISRRAGQYAGAIARARKP